MNAVLQGRVREREAVESLVASRAPSYEAMLLHGEPGIGKSALLHHGVEHARACGVRVLTLTPHEADKCLPYVALADLFASIGKDELIAAAPAQRDVIEYLARGPAEAPVRASRDAAKSALLRGSAAGSVPSPRSMALGTRSVLWTLAERQRLLIAIDDLQWIDADSAQALSFVLRRLPAMADELRRPQHGIRFLGAARAGADWDAVAAWLVAPMQILPVGPLDEAAFRRVLRDQTNCHLTRDAHRHLHATAGGNPTIGIKIAQECARHGQTIGPLHRPDRLPVPDDVARLVTWRLRGLPEDTRTLLLAAAAAVNPWLDRITAVTGCDSAQLSPAVERGLVRLVGQRVRFRDRLLASTVYWQANPAQRRMLHRRFAQTASDIVERAHHLALACTEPDERVANLLETAAACLRARGSPGTAAELAHAAAELTPSTDHEAAVRRLRAAADYHVAAGDYGHATQLLEHVAGDADAGAARAHALAALARLRARTDDVRSAVTLATAAKHETTELALESVIEREAAWTVALAGDLAGAARRAEAAVDFATQSGDPAAMAGGLAIRAWVEALLGRPTDDHAGGSTTPARSGWEPLPAMHFPDVVEALIDLHVGSLDHARVTLFRMQRELVLRGDDHTLAFVLIQLAELECLAGNRRKAQVYADDARELVEQTDQAVLRPWALHACALLEARHGNAVAARRLAERGLVAAERVGAVWLAARNRGVLGFVELSVDDPRRAEHHLDPLVSSLTADAPPTPLACPWVPDAVEALVLVGRRDEAEELLRPYEAAAQSRQWPTGVLAAARCRALVVASQGNHPEAARVLRDALTQYAAATPRFDQARSCLALGMLLRQGKQTTEARLMLEDALRRFEMLESPQWAARAHDELATAEPHHGRPRTPLLATGL